MGPKLKTAEQKLARIAETAGISVVPTHQPR